MKPVFTIIAAILLFSLGSGVLAQITGLPDVGLTPDKPFSLSVT